jgi:hypothetical protein
MPRSRDFEGDQRPKREAMPAGADAGRSASSFEDKIRAVLAVAIVIAFLTVTMTSALTPAIAEPIAFTLGAVGASMVRPVINYYFSRRIH